jgi:hypothetical protein
MNLKVEGSFDEQQEAQGTQQENKTIPSGNAHLLTTHTYQSTTNNHNRQVHTYSVQQPSTAT